MTLIAGAYLKIEEPDLEAAKKWYTEARNTYISDYTHKQNRARGSNIPMQIDLPICLEKRAQFITEVLKPPQYLTAIKDLERAAEIYKDLTTLPRLPTFEYLN
jgi:hypothetical protein